jgi:tRNA-splicing ligase RtcB (3'-phosphate/5'-hydroxy nucleic acid ligase)
MERVMMWLPKAVISCIPESEIMGNNGLREQVSNVASLEPLVGHFALMPDAHSGFGMPIGGVAVLDNAISPNMVGVDIGCGMLAVKTDMLKDELICYRDMYAKKILNRIPVGVGGDRTRSGSHSWDYTGKFVGLDVEFAARQLGTLGSGNHFIELGYDDDDYVWVTIHSGSRRLGQVVANHYHKSALEDCKMNSDLAYLTGGTENFRAYIRDMSAAVAYALLNREYMMNDIFDILGVCAKDEVISIHNFAEENHGLITHRKGATPAKEGQRVVIPMNMGDGIIIGRGRGNDLSWESCSHGAGRSMGRGEAKRTLDEKEQEQYMANRNVKVYTQNGASVLDEMPGAYKDWMQVMSRQSDLVEIETIIHSCATIKG